MVTAALLRCRKSQQGCEFEAGLRHVTTGKLYKPSREWVPFSNQGRLRQLKERDRLRLSSAVPKI